MMLIVARKCKFKFFLSHNIAAIGWDLVNRRVVEVVTDKTVTIRCSCRVINKLWIGVGGSCHILNLQTLKLQVKKKKD